MKYYKAGTKIAPLCKALEKSTNETIAAGKRLARRLGARPSGTFFGENFYGDIYLAGFTFKEPDEARFRRRSKGHDCWVPRLSNKEGRALSEQMAAIKSTGMGDLMDAIGMETFGFFDGELRSRRPGVQKINNAYYLQVLDEVTPHGCTRVSDVHMEKLKGQ